MTAARKPKRCPHNFDVCLLCGWGIKDPTWCGSDGCKGYPDCKFERTCQGDKARPAARGRDGKGRAK